MNLRFALACLLVGLAPLTATRAEEPKSGIFVHDTYFKLASASAEDAGFKPIFDGKTLDGWEGNPKLWSVEDGAITGQTTPENSIKVNTFLIWRQGEVDDFELEADYRIVGGNSGIQYRSFQVPDDKKHPGSFIVGGYQADFEAGDTYSGIIYGERFRGILCERGQKTVIGDDHKPKVVGKVGDTAEIQTHIKKEDWNHYHITAKGNHFTQEINGVMTADCVDEDAKERRASGILALQLHAGEPMKVQFKNIRLKRLPLEGKKKLVMLAGHKSHRYGEHAFRAGCLMLKKRLDDNVPGLVTAVYINDWPADPTAFDNADAVVAYCDGGAGNPLNGRLDEIDALAKKGVGIGCLHYAVETTAGKPGDDFLRWIGGYFEINWSVNPKWTMEHVILAKDHPITRGVKPYELKDEWYYHMRFRPNMEGVTPILTAIPPADSVSKNDEEHSGNPAVRAEVGQPQHLAWAVERPDGGRGFGLTGAHYHINWAQPQQRKLVLNALAWLAKVDVPPQGINSAQPTLEELAENQDFPLPNDKVHELWKRQLESYKSP